MEIFCSPRRTDGHLAMVSLQKFLACITDNPADQPAILRSRDPVMFINIQLCQSTDINLKLALFEGIASVCH